MIEHNKETLLRYRKSIQSLYSHYVAQGKSLDSLLEELVEKWNPLFDIEQKKNLVEDLNALVRDFIRPIKRTFISNPPDVNRFRSLAERLSESKSLGKIKKRDALIRYIELFMVKCLLVNQ